MDEADVVDDSVVYNMTDEVFKDDPEPDYKYHEFKG